MKKIFMVLGIIFTLIIIAGGIAFFILNRYGNGVDKESKDYVDRNLPKIVANWNPNELIKRASPRLLKVASKSRITMLFSGFAKKLGPLEKYNGSKGQGSISVTQKYGKMITGLYFAKAIFKKGKASIKIEIIKTKNKWKILGFHIDSDALFQ